MDDKSFDKMGSCVSPRQMVSSLPPVCDFLDRYDNGASLYPCQATILKIIFLDVEHLDELDRLIIRSWQESTENGGEIIVPLDLYDRMDWRLAPYKPFPATTPRTQFLIMIGSRHTYIVRLLKKLCCRLMLMQSANVK